jgi:hypothetical protein
MSPSAMSMKDACQIGQSIVTSSRILTTGKHVIPCLVRR